MGGFLRLANGQENSSETASVQIEGMTVFLGDCENCLVLVKIYKAAAELPYTAVISRLSHYGCVLSVRRDKIAQFIDNGVRTAQMSITRHIPSIINLAGEFLRKTCRNCGADDHLVKDCSSIHCFNCEIPGHHQENCQQPTNCLVCKGEGHELSACPYILYSANVDSRPKQTQTEEEKQKEKDKFREKVEQAKQKQPEIEKQQQKMQMEFAQRQQSAKEDKGKNKNQDKSDGVDQGIDKKGEKRSEKSKEPERSDSVDRRGAKRAASDDERDV